MPFSKIKHFLVPQDGVFFDFMLREAEVTDIAAGRLHDLVYNYSDVSAKAKAIRELEHEGDEVLRKLHAELSRTFIVPIDHGDISALSESLDDVLDFVDHSANMLVVYEITAPSAGMVRLSSLLVKQTGDLKAAVASLRSQGTYANALEHCLEINRVENEADEVYSSEIGRLLKKNDAIELFKEKEVLACFEDAIDKVDKAAKIISDIILKHS